MSKLGVAAAAVALGMVVFPAQAVANVQDNKAWRLVEAIQGKRDYVDDDFVKPLTDESKDALSNFADCEVRFVGLETADGVIVQPLPATQPTDTVIVGLICDDHPSSAGAGLTIHFDKQKIASIETHAPVSRRDKNG